MPRYHIWTIGCQMNKADSAHISEYLEQLGYFPTTSVEEADLVVLNSCVVRQSAEDRAVNKLNALKGLKKRLPGLKIALTGCLVDSQADELRGRFPHVDLFFKPQGWDVLCRWAEGQALQPGKSAAPVSPVSALVPIIRGCDNFCSYCVVPYRRGREESRPLEEVVCQVERLVRWGGREVTLLGQNVDSYGHDLPSAPDLADLLAELNKIQGLWRIRFLTNHPKDMTPKLIHVVAQLDKVCEHISLPAQAGDDKILQAMRRGYGAEHYRRLVGQIRSAIPNIALSTDIIVGFPGETEEQFEKTYELLRQLRFDKVHIAVYSPRAGTFAARRLADDVPPDEKERRRQKVEALQQSIATEINARLRGRTVEVLVEGKKGGRWQGRTRTDKLVFFDSGADHLGHLEKVSIEHTGPWSLRGQLTQP